MSCNEMGSHSRSRADVITRSTARRCDASVSSRQAELEPLLNAWSSVSFLNTSVCCIFFQRLAQLRGHGNRHDLLAFALHAGDLLLAAGDEFFAAGGVSPVFEVHRDAVLPQFAET